MFEASGSLAIVQPVLTLLGLVALPLIWAMTAALFAGSARAGLRIGGAAHDVIARVSAATCAVGTLGLAVMLAIRLALAPRGHLFVQHVAALARLGQLDLAFDLALDPRSATFAVAVGLVACASALQTSWSSRPDALVRLAWSGLVAGAAMLLCVGDGFAPIVVALGLLSLGSWGLARGGAAASNAASLAGNVAVLVGFVFLFWSLGGAFGAEGYDPDGAPRFVLVTTPSPGADPEKATLVMTTHAGAQVSSDDAELPGEPLVSPLSVVVEPGVHTLRVHGGAASGDVIVPRVALVPGRTHVLTPYGPTASLRALDDQIAVPRLAPAGGAATVRAALAGRTINGLRASAVVLLLALGGALLHLHASASRRGLQALVTVLEVVPAPYLALRLAPLVDPSAADGALVVLLGAGSAVVLAARAASVDDAHQALRGVLAAIASMAVVAAGLGDPAATLILAASAIVSTSAALAAIEARRDARWLGMACAGAVGLLPGAGASSGYVLAIAAALGSAATGSVGWAVFAGGVAASLVVACSLGALAAFRVYDALIRVTAREPGSSRAQGVLVIVLAALALVGGVALGVGTTMFGGHVAPLARRLAGPVALPEHRLMAAAAVVLSLLAALGGVALARRASAASAPPRWLVALGRPYDVLRAAASGLGRAALFLHRSVGAMDRDVIDDVPRALGEVVVRAGRGLRGLLRGVGGRAGPSRDPAAGGVAVELSMVEPSTAERLRTALLLVMVALLGLVVLSSLLLG
ncbi:MAG: hypothetical protein KF894_21845 [Labilithrix sp.]|nr:hypothetical protein [Labilithrix sp.]